MRPQTRDGAAPEGPPRDDREAGKLTTSPRSFKVTRDTDKPQYRPEDEGDDLVSEAIDRIVASAPPLTPGQRDALRRRILGGGAR